jgi:hypothetical protein
MHVDRIPNRTSPPAYLLRETYREDGRVGLDRVLSQGGRQPARVVDLCVAMMVARHRSGLQAGDGAGAR